MAILIYVQFFFLIIILVGVCVRKVASCLVRSSPDQALAGDIALCSWARHFTLTVRLSTQARVVRKVENAIHRINHYPVDSVVCFVNTCPLDSDLSGG